MTKAATVYEGGPEDIAAALVALSHPDLSWMTGNVVNVDGGENVVIKRFARFQVGS